MRAFRFSLARVLRVRRLQEEIARGELLAARGAAQRAWARAREAEAEHERGHDELLDLLSRPRLEAAGLVVRHEAQDLLRVTRSARAAVAVEREQAAELRRAAALEAHAAVRGLERLEERRRAVHAAQLQQAERSGQEEEVLRRAGASCRRPGSSRAGRPSDESPEPSGGPSGRGPHPTDPR